MKNPEKGRKGCGDEETVVEVVFEEGQAGA